MRRELLLPLIGTALFFTFEYVCYAAGRAFAGLSHPFAPLLAANIAGVLAASLIRVPDPAAPARDPAHDSADARRTLRRIALGLIAASGLGGTLCILSPGSGDTASILFTASALFAGVPLPFLFRTLFANAPAQNLGLSLGSCLAAAEMVWIFLHVDQANPLDSSTLHTFLGVVQILTGIVTAAALMGRRADAQRPPRRLLPPCPKRLAMQTLGYLAVIASVFFLLDSIIDLIFYRYDSATQPIPRGISLYVWMAYPILGRLLDRYGAGAGFFLACLGLCIVSPALTVLSQSTPMYWLVFGLDIIGRHGAFLFLTLVFARHADRMRLPGLVVCTPYLLQHAAYLVMWLFFNAFHPGSGFILLISSFLCASFGLLSSRVRYALSLAGHAPALALPLPVTPPRMMMAQPHATEPPTKAELLPRETAPAREATAATQEPGDVPCNGKKAGFVQKYGLSSRETEVLANILGGMSTAAMAEALHISESTVKTHVKNILRKTDTASRNVLMALYMGEE
ncbi:helix-turn-helix transcriptional regulator [Desulfolutivibrio sp.]|uniref:helix-turn-helix transcriptional regulator n=1 Tax=Desulfolutivibrio sp. TaxID=2773296 RepID=UPI002F960D38